MSWHFLQAGEEASWEGSSLDGAPDALSRLMPTPGESFSPGSETASSTPSPSGTTSQPLTENHRGDTSTSSPVDSPARTSARREGEQESTEKGPDSGEKWRASFAKWDPDSSSWKIPQCLFTEGWDEFSGTWPRWGLMRGGECWAQSTPERHIGGNESGLWPTPRNNTGPSTDRRHLFLDGAVKLWPTPIANDWKPNGPNSKQQNLASVVRLWPTPHGFGHGNGPSGNELGRAVNQEMFPTPTARDWKSGKASQTTMDRNSRPLSEQIGGSLSPPWVEWLMGWPLGWTSLQPMPRETFAAWQKAFQSASKS